LFASDLAIRWQRGFGQGVKQGRCQLRPFC